MTGVIAGGANAAGGAVSKLPHSLSSAARRGESCGAASGVKEDTAPVDSEVEGPGEIGALKSPKSTSPAGACGITVLRTVGDVDSAAGSGIAGTAEATVGAMAGAKVATDERTEDTAGVATPAPDERAGPEEDTAGCVAGAGGRGAAKPPKSTAGVTKVTLPKPEREPAEKAAEEADERVEDVTNEGGGAEAGGGLLVGTGVALANSPKSSAAATGVCGTTVGGEGFKTDDVNEEKEVTALAGGVVLMGAEGADEKPEKFVYSVLGFAAEVAIDDTAATVVIVVGALMLPRPVDCSAPAGVAERLANGDEAGKPLKLEKSAEAVCAALGGN